MEHTLIPCDTATILPIIKANRQKLYEGLAALAEENKKTIVDANREYLERLRSASAMDVLTGKVSQVMRGYQLGGERLEGIQLHHAHHLSTFDRAIDLLEGDSAPAFVNMSVADYNHLVRFDLDGDGSIAGFARGKVIPAHALRG